MPWPLMDAFETQVWKASLQALELKTTPENSKIVFRGLSYDTDFRFFGTDGKAGFMSTLLTKNQGNYNRRLRSLTTRRLVNGLFHFDSNDKAPPLPSLLTKQMDSHAEEPKGSAFLSFTGGIDVAASFAAPYDEKKQRVAGAFLAVRVAKSRLIPNGPASSLYAFERELLIPLLTFPEDVVLFEERQKGVVLTTEVLMKHLEAAMTPKEYQAVTAENKVNANKRMILNDYFSFVDSTKTGPPMCTGVFAK